jgi:glutathione S-transferase
MFQMSGQGPYYGQANWFSYLHPEKVPSAIERYQNEARRMLNVLDRVLEGKMWLVGDKMTYADLAFLPWNDRLDLVLGVPVENMLDGFPNVKAWHERMASRPSWVKVIETRTRLMDEQGLMPNGMPKGMKNFQEFEANIKTESAADE